MIELSGISKTFKVMKRDKGSFAAFKSLFHREYDEVKALDEVGFHVSEGEIVGYIGPNGAGKSTTIKVMSGILVPDRGQCRIMGFTPWRDRREYVQSIGVVFGQRTQLWWDVPVQDSYELLRDIYKVPSDKFNNNLDMLIHALDIGELTRVPLRQLSLGQRMRCEIAASLLHSPKILFLDEPTIGLDAVSKLAVRKFIKELNERRKVTVILTTHDMDDIEALTDRILLIGKGRILYDGSMKKIRDRYDILRRLNISFEPCDDPADIRIKGVKLISWENAQACYEVDVTRTTVSDVISALGGQLKIRDMTAANRPVEEIIAELYMEHEL